MGRILTLDHDKTKFKEEGFLRALRTVGHYVEEPVRDTDELDYLLQKNQGPYDLFLAHPNPEYFDETAALARCWLGAELRVLYVSSWVERSNKKPRIERAEIGLMQDSGPIGFYYFAEHLPTPEQLVAGVEHLTGLSAANSGRS